MTLPSRLTFDFRPPRPLSDDRINVKCAVCNRKADWVGQEFDIFQQAFVVKVECHGEKDTCLFPLSLFKDGPVRINDIVAFEKQAQLADTKQLPAPEDRAFWNLWSAWR